MKTGNYQVKGGKVHQLKRYYFYECNILRARGTEPDTLTTKPVTCKSCIKAMGRMK